MYQTRWQWDEVFSAMDERIMIAFEDIHPKKQKKMMIYVFIASSR